MNISANVFRHGSGIKPTISMLSHKFAVDVRSALSMCGSGTGNGTPALIWPIRASESHPFRCGPNRSRAWHFRRRGKAVSRARRACPLCRRPIPCRASEIRVAWLRRVVPSLRSGPLLLAMLAPRRARREPRPPSSLCSLLAPSPRLSARAASCVAVRGPPRHANWLLATASILSGPTFAGPQPDRSMTTVWDKPHYRFRRVCGHRWRRIAEGGPNEVAKGCRRKSDTVRQCRMRNRTWPQGFRFRPPPVCRTTHPCSVFSKHSRTTSWRQTDHGGQ